MNLARDSENKVHDDAIAQRYGFRAGLVAGVDVYGGMWVLIMRRFGPNWWDRGRIAMKFLQPFYEGEMIVLRGREDGSEFAITAEDESGVVRATARAALGANLKAELPPIASLPVERPVASHETIYAGRVLGTVNTQLSEFLPRALLGLANELVVANYRISPWLHTASEVVCYRRPQPNLSVRGVVRECYEKRGHQFMVLDVAIVGNDLIQRIKHTAIWKLRE